MYLTLRFVDEGWLEPTVQSMDAFALEHRQELRAANREARFLADLFAEMGRRGWVGPITPVSDGGSGLGVAEYCVIEEEVGRLGLVSPRYLHPGPTLAPRLGHRRTTPALPVRIARGEIIFSESISEPGVWFIDQANAGAGGARR